ncbi:HNH endonuclease [Microbacterium sp. IEGM 1404]|uniref:HNH endonuclease n=1 Tax=Microbacterium sp. IEGM 1404 TaxID=3047084 RepID=UPI0024B81875|nr:HNH endonuclease signature motif containing protein [Microbacterium sp. IEGM 1404]MDI9891038.1 DUF222 domain-containing protein [Microbacterium sp. IEGM 1404]
MLSVLVTEVVRAEAVVAAAEVARVRALAAAGRFARESSSRTRASGRAAEMALREVASEIAAACRVSDRAVQRDVDEAMTLVESFPKVVAAWEAGAVSRRHVRVIAEVGVQLPAEKRAEFDALAAALAGEVSSPGRLKSRLTIASEALQPRTITERHRAAREGRCVRIVPGAEGMSDLIATLPTVLAEAVFDRLTQQARVIVDARPDEAATARATTPRSPAARGSVGSSGSAKAPDTRSVDQVRADVFADMLLTADPAIDPTRIGDGPGTLGRIRARVQVVVPALTVLDPARETTAPAELVGRGPIDTALARDLADATSVPWDRVITHPVSGAVLHTDTYARTAAIDRHLRARDRHCRWPGCITPAIRSEVDHTLDHHLGGATRVSNLAHLCQRHRTQKQFTRWTVRQGDAGVLEWTSPTGRTYTDTPDPYPSAGVTHRRSPSTEQGPHATAPRVRFLPDDGSADVPPRSASDVPPW